MDADLQDPFAVIPEMINRYAVAPHAGAWIETYTTRSPTVMTHCK